MIECEALMIVIGMWLNSVEQDKLLESVVIEKILEILLRLNFTVDLLVKYKFGRVIKKITQQKEKTIFKSKTTCLNLEMATKLFDSWSALANNSEIPNVPRRKSEEDIERKEEESFNEQISIQRPKSPEISIESTSIKRTSTIVMNDDSDKSKKIKYSETRKKSVTFPETHSELCKVILFERAPEEYEYLSDGSASRDNYLHADVGEASKAFGNSIDTEDYSDFNLKPWKELEAIEGSKSDRPDGIDSEEKIIQHQRERSVLSVNYYSLSDIPPNPSEEDVDTATEDSDSLAIKTIPIRPNEKIIQQKVVIKQKTPIIDFPKFFTPDLINNFITNDSGFNNLLNPFVSSSKDPSRDLKTKSNKSNDPNSICSSKNLIIQAPSHPSSQKESEYRGYSAKSICNYYRPGKPFSCRLGSSCRFIHQD